MSVITPLVGMGRVVTPGLGHFLGAEAEALLSLQAIIAVSINVTNAAALIPAISGKFFVKLQHTEYGKQLRWLQ